MSNAAKSEEGKGRVDETIPPSGSSHFNQVIRAAKLGRLTLTHTSHNVAEQAYNPNLRPDLTWTCPDFQFDSEEGQAVAIFEWVAVAHHESEPAFETRARYVVVYVGLKGCSEAAVRQFVEHVGNMAVYPYFRSLCHVMLQESQVSMPPLPVLTTDMLYGLRHRPSDAPPSLDALAEVADES